MGHLQSYRHSTFFGNKQYPDDVKKKYLTFIAICLMSNAMFTGLVEDVKVWSTGVRLSD